MLKRIERCSVKIFPSKHKRSAAFKGIMRIFQQIMSYLFRKSKASDIIEVFIAVTIVTNTNRYYNFRCTVISKIRFLNAYRLLVLSHDYLRRQEK